MTPLSSLGTFLTLAFVMPGIVIISVAVILFPDVRIFVEHLSVIEIIAGIIVVSFFNGHFAFLYERHALDYLWDRLYPDFKFLKRRDIRSRRSEIITLAESKGINHSYFDVSFGEFVFYTNTMFWVFLMSFCKLPFCRSPIEGAVCAFILMTATISITATSPFFKNQYIKSLEILDEKTRVAASISVPTDAEHTEERAETEVELAVAHEFESHH